MHRFEISLEQRQLLLEGSVGITRREALVGGSPSLVRILCTLLVSPTQLYSHWGGTSQCPVHRLYEKKNLPFVWPLSI